MQPIITKELIESLNINLSGQDAETLLTHLNETLQERVGAEITESLGDEQLKDLLDVQEKGDNQAVAVWLQANVPELEAIVQDEVDILLGEVASSGDAINEAK